MDEFGPGKTVPREQFILNRAWLVVSPFEGPEKVRDVGERGKLTEGANEDRLEEVLC